MTFSPGSKWPELAAQIYEDANIQTVEQFKVKLEVKIRERIAIQNGSMIAYRKFSDPVEALKWVLRDILEVSVI